MIDHLLKYIEDMLVFRRIKMEVPALLDLTRRRF